jgi:hypothetical protein
MGFPEIQCCVICEGVRQEIMQKHILLGVFGVTPHVQIAIKRFDLPLNLWFAFFGGGGAGKFRCSLELHDENNVMLSNLVENSVEGELDPQKLNTSVFLAFGGLVPKAGKYRIGFLVNEKPHYTSYIQIAPMD